MKQFEFSQSMPLYLVYSAYKDGIITAEEKRKMKEMADSLSSTLDYSYIYERFKKYDWEVDNIDKAFFDMKRGSYVIERYRTHIKHFGFNEDIYKLFFNVFYTKYICFFTFVYK